MHEPSDDVVGNLGLAASISTTPRLSTLTVLNLGLAEKPPASSHFATTVRTLALKAA